MPGPPIDFPAAAHYIVPERAATVETRAFDYDTLVRPLEGRMMRCVWRIVRQREAAEDALQDALTVIWRKRDMVARHPKPDALLLRIAVGSALDALRKSRRRLRHEIAGLPADGGADQAGPGVCQEAENRDLRAAVLEAIGRLSRRQATAVLLRLVEDQSYEDIAGAMGCSESTARGHVMRGRKRLAERLAHDLPGLAKPSHRGEKNGKEGTL